MTLRSKGWIFDYQGTQVASTEAAIPAPTHVAMAGDGRGSARVVFETAGKLSLSNVDPSGTIGTPGDTAPLIYGFLD